MGRRMGGPCCVRLKSEEKQLEPQQPGRGVGDGRENPDRSACSPSRKAFRIGEDFAYVLSCLSNYDSQ